MRAPFCNKRPVTKKMHNLLPKTVQNLKFQFFFFIFTQKSRSDIHFEFSLFWVTSFGFDPSVVDEALINYLLSAVYVLINYVLSAVDEVLINYLLSAVA